MIRAFGTNYLTKVIMGAKHGISSFIQKEKIKEFERRALTINIGASLSFLKERGVVQNDYDRQRAELFNSLRAEYQEFTVGALPSRDGKEETWRENMFKSPYPMKYDLSPIENLFTKEYLPEEDEQILKLKKERLVLHLRSYCNHLETCEYPKPTIRDIDLYIITSRTNEVKCKGNDKALSCGISTSWNYNNFQLTTPVSLMGLDL